MPVTAEAEELGLDGRRLERIGDWMARYVEAGKLAGALTLVARHGEIAYLDGRGLRDREAGAAVTEDTVFRIYSMTKPITSVAAMMLFEEGCFQLGDPLARYLPEFADMRVWTGGKGAAMKTEPAHRPICIHDLFVHMSGLTYDFFDDTPIDALYREQGISLPGSTEPLATVIERLAGLPLLSQPGAEWNYSVATDVLGRLVEVWSGQTLDRFFAERIFAPLGMTETGFVVPAGRLDRFAALYGLKDGALDLLEAPARSRFALEGRALSGGGGLCGTIGDYFRFAEMLRCKGAFDGGRLLSPKTVEYMTRNHLDGDLAANGQSVFSETSYDGIGFGLGFSVVLDPAKAKVMASVGEYAWGGAASTVFWNDPEEDVSVIFMTQLLPSSTWPLRPELRALVYQALDD